MTEPTQPTLVGLPRRNVRGDEYVHIYDLEAVLAVLRKEVEGARKQFESANNEGHWPSFAGGFEQLITFMERQLGLGGGQ